MQGDHLKTQNNGPRIPGQLSRAHVMRIYYARLKMGDGRIDPQLVEDITVKYNKPPCVIVIGLLVDLNKLELENLHSFLLSICLL